MKKPALKSFLRAARPPIGLGWSVASFLVLFSVAIEGQTGQAWIRAGQNTNQPVWGMRGGLVWAIHPGGFRPYEPRGLIRLGYPIFRGGGYDLINFIAIEPVVNGRRGFSELEHSQLDNVPGKRIWVEISKDIAVSQSGLFPGRLIQRGSEAEQLEVPLRVERFENGAEVRLRVVQRRDAPDELELVLETVKGSAPLDYCILTATMGNMARTRQLWLKDEVVGSLALYPEHRNAQFAPHQVFDLERLHRTDPGDVLVALTTDEVNPSAVFPFPHSRAWHYGGMKVTQYWRKPKESLRGKLQAAVNARYTYWQTKRPIPGGVAFENFELREPFRQGQTFVFGITRLTPAELGFKTRP